MRDCQELVWSGGKMAVSGEKKQGPGGRGAGKCPKWLRVGWPAPQTISHLYDSCESGLGLAPGALKTRGVGFRGRILAFEIFEGSPR